MNIFSKLYAHWFLQKTLVETNPFIYWDIKNDVDKKEWVCDLTLYGTKRQYQVALHINRTLYIQLGLSKPLDCVEVPLAVDKKQQNNKKEIAFVKRFNIDNLRFVCSQRLRYSSIMKIIIPAANLSNGSGEIAAQYDSAVGFGGQIKFGSYPIGLADLERITRSHEQRDNLFRTWQQHNPEWCNNQIEATGSNLV